MLTAIKDLIAAIAAVTVLAYSTDQQEWLWKQVAVLRFKVLIESKENWGCPSIFNKSACQNIDNP